MHRLGGIRREVGRQEVAAFRARSEMGFRSRPAAVVTDPITEGTLNLPLDCERAARVAGGPLKFTLTSPYMLARTLLDEHYGNLEALTLALADTMAVQVRELDCACVQVDEANIPGNPADGPLAAEAINRLLDAAPRGKAVHFCF
ncbi:MAG: methionine synthase, partial [Verrucomicrobiae bacterium]|nr:methionine synthase [Verrucomicrobiae bacterium]